MMGIRTFVLTLHTNGDVASEALLETVKAALYQTYANPMREDNGITTVHVAEALVHTNNPRSWRATGDN